MTILMRYVGLLVLAVMTLAPVPALAQNATLYEVLEGVKFTKGKFERRLAIAGLVGWADKGSPVCPEKIFNDVAGKCAVSAIAWDTINLATGVGPMVGEFMVVTQDMNPVDGPEVVRIRGTLHGTVDLTNAAIGLGTLTASYRADGVPGTPAQGFRVKGTLTGVFRLPFLKDGVPHYVDENFQQVPVLPEELSVGHQPQVKLEIKFE